MRTLIAYTHRLSFALFFLLGSSTQRAISTALQRKGKLQAEEVLKQEHSPFFFRHFLNLFFGNKKWEGLLFSLSFTGASVADRLGTHSIFFSYWTKIFLIMHLSKPVSSKYTFNSPLIPDHRRSHRYLFARLSIFYSACSLN